MPSLALALSKRSFAGNAEEASGSSLRCNKGPATLHLAMEDKPDRMRGITLMGDERREAWFLLRGRWNGRQNRCAVKALS